MKVPASIWSGIIEYSVPCNLLTPFILITSVPAPFISAPMLFKKLATSTICGSFATFSITVFPGIKLAASIIFIVAPTETISKNICAPLSLSELALILPELISIFAPNALKPFKCWSIGLAPISQPPGSATSAL